MNRSLLSLLPLCLLGCQQLNPNSGRFSCQTTPDCGEGFECRPQFAGKSRCFKVGECVETELCDGADQNCDGRIDETFPEQGQACVTGRQGLCAAGLQVCVVGTLSCMQTVMPTSELCNGLDDNCNGAIDDPFDFASDEANCGACGRRCDGGTTCITSSCQESTCDDGADNDLDGVTDCLDSSCLGQVCSTPMPPPWRCGARPADAGATDAGEADAGADDAGVADGGPVLGCYAPEQDCANGFDDDGDGEADCLDVDCAGLVCASGTQCANRSCPGPG